MVLDAGRIKHRADIAHRSIGSNGLAIPSNWRLSADGLKNTIWTPESATSVSYGSNSNDVSSVGAAGASTLVTRADHVHRGVRTVTSNGSNGLFGDVDLVAGTNIALGVTGQAITVTSLAAGGSGAGLTITEVDGSPSVVATSLKLPNGTLSVVGTVATYTPAAGSGSSPYGLDNVALNGTYGDSFAGASLDGKWTRHVQTSGEETYQAGASASALKVAYSTAAAARYIYQTAPNGTNETWETSVTWYQETTTGQMFALLMVDNSGNGVAAFVYDATRGLYLANVASHIYTSVLTNNTNLKDPIGFHEYGGRMWLRLRKAAGLYAASYSFDGETYSAEVTGTPSAFTPTRVGIGRILGTNANSVGFWHWFNKTA